MQNGGAVIEKPHLSPYQVAASSWHGEGSETCLLLVLRPPLSPSQVTGLTTHCLRVRLNLSTAQGSPHTRGL